MSDVFVRLLKVIDLERKQGFRNKAVVGGLDKFASRWETDARADTANSAAVGEIVALLIGYSAVEDPTARERILDQIARRASEASGATETSLPQPPVPASPPAESLPAEAPGLGLPRQSKPIPPYVPPAMPPATPSAPQEPAGRPIPALSKPERTQPGGASVGGASSAGSGAGTSGSGAGISGSGAGMSGPSVGGPATNSGVRHLPQASRVGSQPAGPAPAPPEGLPRLAAPRPVSKPDRVTVPLQAADTVAMDAPVTAIAGVGPSFAARLAKLGVTTVRDLLYLLPRRYDDFSQLATIDHLEYGQEVTVIGTVWSLERRTIGIERKMVIATVGDGTGEMQMTWFNPFVERRLRSGRAYSFSGKIDSYRGRLVIRNPAFEPLEQSQVHTGRLVPIYPQTEGITSRWLRLVIQRALAASVGSAPDPLPESVRRDARLLTLADALNQIHFPDNAERLAKAHRRLSFDELLTLQLGMLAHRSACRSDRARPLHLDEPALSAFTGHLPFELTGAQQRCLTSILADLERKQPMARLLQGDVGSGKTAVAAAALWAAVANGTQGAIMAPTEILAEQHARSLGRLFGGLDHPTLGRPLRVELFTGGMQRAEREDALADLAAGEIDIAVGTHALIEEDVAFRELTLAVVDEQHRFGVEQRAALRLKGCPPHMLVMSATPIPRSLALTVFGDLDVSVIDEMPAGRLPVRTKWLAARERERAYGFLRREVASRRQGFIIYPMVEESENSPAKAAVEEHARLRQNVFPTERLGLLHGRLSSEEKDSVMRAFSAGELDILVATSVVEVGIDVPNASVIVIENAERFGLAQLHQFRGRVGRGECASYCILISDAESGPGVQRLEALEHSNDGFALAQIDLDMRGPGDFFGTRQSGLPPLTTARLSDVKTLELARETAQKLFDADPNLAQPEHEALGALVKRFWSTVGAPS